MADPVVPVAPVVPWHTAAKVDPEIVGYWGNRGWADKDAATIAVEASKAHREAEKFIGAPANELIRVPKDVKDEAGWNTVWSKLGKPAAAKDYDFTNVKVGETKLDPAFDASFREDALKLHLPKDTAAAVAQAVLTIKTKADAAEAANVAATLETERATLAKNWGPNKDANMFVAQSAVKALGIDPEAVNALEGKLGYAKVMEMFRTIGSKIGEDKFVQGPNAGGGGVMTRDQATAQRTALMADQAWVGRYLNGDVAANREMMALNTLIVGDDTEQSRRV